MFTLKEMKFLLDENVSIKIVQPLTELGFNVSSVKKINQLGIKNGSLSKYIKENNWVLLTHDRDFLSYCIKFRLQVILITIHPATIKKILPSVKYFFENYNETLPDNFLVKIRDGSYSVSKY